MTLDEEIAREKRRQHKAWRDKNPEKCKQYRENYWKRKLLIQKLNEKETKNNA